LRLEMTYCCVSCITAPPVEKRMVPSHPKLLQALSTVLSRLLSSVMK
jgi:hypothetical protein